jgi:hypothetical protein
MRATRVGLAAGCVLLPYGCADVIGIGDISAAPDGGKGDGGSRADSDTGGDATDAIPDGDDGGVDDAGPLEDGESAPETETGVDDAGPPDSGSTPETGTGVDDAGPLDSGSARDTGAPIEASAGCPSQNASTLATKITFTVSWPSTASSNAGTGSVNLLLLTNVTGTTTFSGTSQWCGQTFPDVILNALGMTATGGGTKMLYEVPNATWDSITRTFPVTGTQSGFDIGDTLDISPSTGLLGLADSSGYGTPASAPSKAWPPACSSSSCLPAGSFMTSDLQDDDGDGNPGITAVPSNTGGYADPPTTTTFAAAASLVYVVSRTTMQLSGMHTVDCTHGAGTASITLFDTHVVGCKAICPSGVLGCNTGSTPQACTSAQVGFLDANRPVYGYDMTAGDTVSAAHPIAGSFSTVQLSGGAACSAARAAFSPTFD